jgi:hypothetical protein
LIGAPEVQNIEKKKYRNKKWIHSKAMPMITRRKLESVQEIKVGP